MINSSNTIASPQLTSVETNLAHLRNKWRKHFAFEYNQVKCINKWIGDGKVMDVGEEISQSLVLHKRKNYSSFSLSFLGCGAVTENSLRPFLHNILPELKDIKEFKLKMHYYNEPRQNSYKIVFQETLRNLTKLESLTLDFHGAFWNNVIDDDVIQFLAKEIGKNQDKLKHLKLYFGKCRNLSSRALEAIGREVGRRLCSLQSLTLKITGGTEQINNEALEVICYGISKYQIKLKKLCLDVSGSSSMDDEGLKLIVNAITKRFDQLEWLSLDFSMCSNITNKGLELLSQKIATGLPNLRYFKLGFLQSENMKEEVCLKDVIRCEKTTPKIRDILRQNLRHIPQISYVF